MEDWKTEMTPSLMSLGKADAEAATTALHKLANEAHSALEVEVDEDMDTDAEQLCDCKFSLAYGSKILLNQARLRLKRGKRYGIVAPKSAGKTTLLKAISNNQLEGFPKPDMLKTVFVEDDIQGSTAKMNVVEFVLDTVGSSTVTKEGVEEMLISVGYVGALQMFALFLFWSFIVLK